MRSPSTSPDTPPDEVTEAMDRVVERLGETATDEFVGSAARQTLERSEW